MSRRAKIGSGVLVVLLALFLVISWYFAGLVITPHRVAIADSEVWLAERNGIPYEEQMAPFGEPQPFSVTGERDVEIKGWFFDNSAECAVIIAHGWSSNRLGSQKFMSTFWDLGCDVVVYDHRGHGESGGEYGTAGNLEKLDLLTVTDWVSAETSLPRSKIGWHGTSWGAATAIQAAALDNEIAFAIADSSFKDWETAIAERAIRDFGNPVKIFIGSSMSMAGMRTGTTYKTGSPYLAASDIEVPVLLIHSTTDLQTDSQQSAEIFSQLDPAISVFHHTEWGARHGRDIDVRPDEYRALVYDFIDIYVGEFGNTGR